MKPRLYRRRSILAGAAIAPVVTAFPGLRSRAGTLGVHNKRTVSVIIDTNFACSQQFERLVQHSARAVERISGDITPAWIAFMRSRADAKKAVLGLTTAQSLFAFHLMVRPEGYRLVFCDSDPPMHSATAMTQLTACALEQLESVAAYSAGRMPPLPGPGESGEKPTIWLLTPVTKKRTSA